MRRFTASPDADARTAAVAARATREGAVNRRSLAGRAAGAGLGACVACGALAACVLAADGAPLGPDGDLLDWSTGHRPSAAVTLARCLTATGTGVVPYALAVVAGVIVGRGTRQRLFAAALCAACLLAEQAARYATMSLIARPRPPREDWQAHASGWSFPSGHTTTAALTAALLVIAVLLRAPRGAPATAAVIACWGIGVGLTRVYLGVHWATDVAGGWLFAAGWLGLCTGAAARWLPEGIIAPGADTADGPHRPFAAESTAPDRNRGGAL